MTAINRHGTIKKEDRMQKLPKDRFLVLQAKAFDIIDKIDIDSLSEGINTAELAYILSMVDNIVTITTSLKIKNFSEEVDNEKPT